MELDTNRYIWAVFLAPFSAGVGMSISSFISNPHLDGSILLAPILLFPITYPFALLGLCVLGMPSFWLLKKVKLLNFFTLSFVGLPLGYLSAVITGDLNDPGWLQIACIVGITVSTTAALIMLKKPNKVKNNVPLARTPQKTRRPF